jgi:acyl-CoA thioesterase-1
MFLKKIVILFCVILSFLFSCTTDYQIPSYADNTIRVAAVGDSITYGYSIRNRDVNSYPAQLKKKLGTRWSVGNFGMNGATLLKKGNRPYWETEKLSNISEFQPSVIVINLGANDSKSMNWQFRDQFVPDYIELITFFRQLKSNPQIFICYPVPAYPGRFGIRDHIIKNEIIPLINQVAEETGIKIIDLYKALSYKKELFPDTVHPNAEGAELIAETIFLYITDESL